MNQKSEGIRSPRGLRLLFFFAIVILNLGLLIIWRSVLLVTIVWIIEMGILILLRKRKTGQQSETQTSRT
jgi:hypothetical protein